MIQTILTVSVSTITGSVIGYCISTIKKYKAKLNEKIEEEKTQKEALMIMLQNNLTNTYFVYNEIGKITDYVLKNWLNSFKIYKKLGGNDYIDTIKSKIDNWEITETDILEK